MSTPAPMMPPKRMFPKAMPLVVDFTAVTPGSKASCAQLTDKSLKLRCTVTDPGVVTYHVPLSLDKVHFAPATSAPAWLWVVTDSGWLWPLTIDAHPVNPVQAATAATLKTLMVPSLLVLEVHAVYGCDCRAGPRGRSTGFEQCNLARDALQLSRGRVGVPQQSL